MDKIIEQIEKMTGKVIDDNFIGDSHKVVRNLRLMVVSLLCEKFTVKAVGERLKMSEQNISVHLRDFRKRVFTVLEFKNEYESLKSEIK